MITARDRFAKGDRVKLTLEAESRLWLNGHNPKAGVVVGFGIRNPRCVWVTRDGTKSRECIHMSLLEHVEP